jgi:uncharacterized RDD family membrane protein YckC
VTVTKPPTRVVGRRVAAFLIDGVIGTAVWAAVFFSMAEKESEYAPKVLTGEIDPDTTVYGNIEINDDTYSIVGGDFLLFLAIVGAFAIVYHWILPGLTGWTPGKLLMGLRIVRPDGRVAGIWRNAVRSLLWIVDYFPYIIPALTGFILALATRGNRRVGDMVADTYVVRASAAGAPIAVDPAVPAGAAPPATWAAPTPPG